jgi:thiol:disulfide interchange protein DsbC
MRISLLAIGLLLVAQVGAATPEDTVRKAMAVLAPSVKVEMVQESAVPGFYEAIVGPEFVYVSKDGRFVLDGNAYDVAHKTDLTASSRAKVRKVALDKVGPEDRISFSPDKPKYRVTVFTDVDCPFCRRFHQQIAQYNAKGIAVDYLFYPLSIHPGADKKAESVWCADDRRSAFTKVMAGGDAGQATCPNPVAELTELGKTLGISGTPTMLAADGTQIPGQIAMSPDKLAEALDHMAAQAAAATN